MVCFLLNSFYDKESREKLGQAPEWKEVTVLHNVHKDLIQSLVQFGSAQRFLTVSRDGYANVWSNRKLINTQRFTSDLCQLRDIWVTAVEYMKNINKVAVAFTSKEIAIYEASLNHEFICQYRIQKLQQIPMCFFYSSQPSTANDGILLFGDSEGTNWGLYFSNPGLSLFERSVGSNDRDQTDMCTKLTIGDILSNKHSSCSCFKYNAHDAYVKQIMFTSQIELVISCSSSWSKSLAVAWLDKEFIPHKRYNVARINVVAIYQGINAFDYNPLTNMIATAGINYHITLRSFYIDSKPSNVFYGHVAPVLHVKFLTLKNQLLSIGKDRMLRIWDLYLLSCIQRVAYIFPRSHEYLTYMLFEEENNRLVISSNTSLVLTERVDEIEDRIKSHNKAVVAIEYDFATNQLVSVSVDGSASVWIISNGQRIKKFESLHGTSEITALAIYEQTPGFLTAASDGLVKVWNYNGSCLYTLECCSSVHQEIKNIVVLRRFICVLGWSNSFELFSSVEFKGHRIRPVSYRDNPYHPDDIVCCDYISQTTLLTASQEGLIVTWNIFSEQVIKVMRVLEESSQSRPQSKSWNTSKSSIPKKEESDSISQIIFLRKRDANRMANLIVVTTNLWLYFWNFHNETLQGQFKAQENVESIICAVDKDNKYLVVGDSDGIVTLWDIQSFCTDENPYEGKPEMLHMLNHQSDCITSVQILEHFDRTLIICSSIDCSVVLYDLKGHLIGIFGQPEYWNVKHVSQLNKDTHLYSEPIQRQESTMLSTKLSLVSEKEYDEDYEVWGQTILGKKYQHHYQTREAPSHNKHKIQFYDKHKAYTHSTAFSALDLQELENPPIINKPNLSMSPITQELSPSHRQFPARDLKKLITEKMLFPKLAIFR